MKNFKDNKIAYIVGIISLLCIFTGIQQKIYSSVILFIIVLCLCIYKIIKPKNNIAKEENTINNEVEQNIIEKPKEKKKITISASHWYNDYRLAYKYDNVKIIASRFENIKIGDKIKFSVQEDLSVKVIVDSIGEIGTLNSGTIKNMVIDYMKSDKPISSVISGISNEITLYIAFYGRKKDSFILREFKLVGNKNQELQDNILSCSVDDDVTFEYDYEKEQYLALSIIEIGYAPKSFNSFFEENERYIANIKDISENDNGKYEVMVEVS